VALVARSAEGAEVAGAGDDPGATEAGVSGQASPRLTWPSVQTQTPQGSAEATLMGTQAAWVGQSAPVRQPPSHVCASSGVERALAGQHSHSQYQHIATYGF